MTNDNEKTTIYKALHRKLHIEEHELRKKNQKKNQQEWTDVLRKGKQFLLY